MKNYNKYICLFLLLLGTSTYAWGAKILQFDFSEAVTGWPTVTGGSATTKTYTLVNNYTFSLGPNVYFNTYDEDTYLMLRNDTYLGLPAISNYKLTKVEITNSSGCSTSAKVAVCTSSAGSSTVSGGSTTQLSTVSTTYTFNLSGTSANTAYYLYFTNKNCQLKNITLTYTPTSACTVTFNAGTGTSTSSLTEGSAGSGIVLPTATPASDCSSEYEFWGWTTEACEDETEEPLTMYFAGNKFYPESNCTLYAVYVSDKSATLDYVAISRGAEIKSGEQYIIEAYANEEDHALKAAVKSTNYLDEKDITDDISSDIYNEDPADNTIIWTITQEASETNVSLYNASSSSYLWIKSTSPYYLALNASKQTFTIAYEDHGEGYLGTFSLKNSNSKYVSYDEENDRFTSSTSSDRNLYLYRRLYTGTFNTSPVCCDKIVALSKGTETNATISSFSPSSVPTCSATDADRNVTITVAAATGYEFTSSARLSYSGDGTATYVSGPTGSGPYTFVYRLSQNANGSGTFSVESATPKNYTISFNANGGTGSMDNVVQAYGTTYDLPANGFTRPAGKMFKCWAQGSAGGTERAVGYTHTISGDITFYAVWRDAVYTEAKFSCAELTLTPKPATEGTPFFITSRAEQTVRSQDSILVVGNGLSPNTTLTYPGLSSKFVIKTRLGADLQTDVNGEINAVAYIYYTPGSGDTSDGLDELAGISFSVGGTKPKTAVLEQEIYGRHLPEDFVIAAKYNGKWYAIPDTMTTLCHPEPIEIAVDDTDNPSVAYSARTNFYKLYGQSSSTIGGVAGKLYSNGEMIKLAMRNNEVYVNSPLFGSTGTQIGKSGTASVTNNIDKQYWWKLTQTNTSIENPKDAKYIITSANNSNPLKLYKTNFIWGLYAYKDGTAISELRLIPASEDGVVFAEANIVAWGKNSAIVEVDNSSMIAHTVKAKLPGDIESGNIELVETRTSVKGTGTRYNYTVNFGEGVDFSANEGKMLTLEWYDILDNLKAISNVIVPRIVATNTTINSGNYSTKSVWATEVHVLPGDTLFIDASGYSPNKNVTINELHIYPNATVQVLKDTLIVKNLILRNGWNRLTAETEYDVARLYIKPGSGNGSLKATNAYLDWYIDYDQYYPIAVPWKVATSSISYQNMTVATSAGLFVRYYDGERHAKGGDGNTNWKQYTWGGTMPANLEPGIGYAITARRPAGKAFSIIRMPLTIPSAAWTTNGELGEVSSVHKDQVAVTAWVKDEGETPDHAKGWNFIANPYMSMYQGDITHSEGDSYDIAYVNIPDVNFKEFEQVEISDAKLKPGSGFLIQTEETGTLTFGTSNRKASAPSYRTATPKATKQKAYIILSGEEAEDKMGLIISERYTAEYEINADLEKLLSDGNTLRTYMIYNNINMAYVAINEDLAREWIPVTVRIPAAGEYTFSLHEASKISELEGIYLIDYTNNVVTNLIENNYSFVAAEGTIADRFAINAIVGKHDTPTDIDIINAGGDIHSDKPVKFIYRDKVYILNRGVIYDSTGKKVREINK